MRRVVLSAVPGALAAAAVLGTGLASPAAAAECGTPAQPPVHSTVVHPAVTQVVPAVTHQEWLWSRQVTTIEREATRTTPGYDVLRWSRTTDVREREYEEKVVDQAHVPATAGTPEVGHWETVVVTPAVTMTLWEYQQLQTGNTRWEREGWNAGDNGKGWAATGATDVVVVSPEVTRNDWIVDAVAVPGTPEVPEVSHLVLHWLPETSSPPAGWTSTGGTRVASSTTETLDLPDGEAPEGSGWMVGDIVETIAPVVETLWLGAGESLPEGYAETGLQDVQTDEETTTEHRAAPPEGAGWARVGGSARTVVDEPARVVVVTPATTEQVLVSPGAPAGPACPTGHGTVLPPLAPEQPEAAPEQPQAGTAVATQVGAAAASVAGFLPATGSAIPAWVPGAGLLSVLAGVVLVRRARN